MNIMNVCYTDHFMLTRIKKISHTYRFRNTQFYRIGLEMSWTKEYSTKN